MQTNLSNFPILFVDDDELWLDNTIRGLKILGIKLAEGCSNPLLVLDLLKKKEYGLVVIDLWMPQKPGEILLNEIKEHYPNIPVIIITADNQIDTAVKCMQQGAINYLTKPIQPNQVITHIKQVLENLNKQSSASDNSEVNLNLHSPLNYHGTLSQTDSMRKIFEFIDSQAQSYLPYLIIGESGCGKTQLAKSIHKAYRRNGDFITFDLSVIENQFNFFNSHSIESFDTIINSKNGITILFKNSDLLTKDSQLVLFKYFQKIQELHHNSISAVSELPRLIFSTTINIITKNILIPDLEYLLKIQSITIPPLRKRTIDISLLATYFINEYITLHNINMPHVPKELLPLLEQYHFPGNIKELRDMFEYALANCNRGKLSMESFKEHMDLHRNIDKIFNAKNIFSVCNVLPTLKEAQHLLILEALERTGGNQAHAAHLLGITRQGLNRKIQSFNIKI